MNPMQQIMALLKSGNNPQQIVMNLMQNQMGNSPMGQNLINLAQNGNSSEIEKIARNFCKQNGINFDSEFNNFKQMLGLK